jgi:hypothetical protein
MMIQTNDQRPETVCATPATAAMDRVHADLEAARKAPLAAREIAEQAYRESPAGIRDKLLAEQEAVRSKTAAGAIEATRGTAAAAIQAMPTDPNAAPGSQEAIRAAAAAGYVCPLCNCEASAFVR